MYDNKTQSITNIVTNTDYNVIMKYMYTCTVEINLIMSWINYVQYYWGLF